MGKREVNGVSKTGSKPNTIFIFFFVCYCCSKFVLGICIKWFGIRKGINEENVWELRF